MKVEDAVEMMDKKWIRDDSIDLANKFLQEELVKLSKESSISVMGKRKSPVSVTSTAINHDLSRMVEDLSIDKEEWVAKVTPDRIYSVATHPSETKLIACAGDKWGYIGLWDVDAPITDDSHNGVYLFRVHSRPVCGLQWATGDSLISASYDGTIRRLNVETGTFQEIFASYDDTNTYYAEELGFGLDEGYNFWHQHVSLDHRSAQADSCLFLATSVGKALHLDLRIADKQRITFNEQLSDKKINTLR
jgi:WD40 repeat protein